MSFCIAVLVSGNGSNLQAIIDAVDSKKLNLVISCVISDRSCYALQRAKSHGIPYYKLNRGTNLSSDIDCILENHGVNFIVLAGFLSILSPFFCNKWYKKIINVHPSLLPKYGGMGMWGMNVHQSVIDNNEKYSGATVHYVTSNIDEGAIIGQMSCMVDENETAHSLAQKVHKLEHEILIQSIYKITENKLKM